MGDPLLMKPNVFSTLTDFGEKNARLSGRMVALARFLLAFAPR
jgi:hypothetical protein